MKRGAEGNKEQQSVEKRIDRRTNERGQNDETDNDIGQSGTTTREDLNRPITTRITPTNKTEKLPPTPPNVKLDFKPILRRNYLQLRIKNSQESTK